MRRRQAPVDDGEHARLHLSRHVPIAQPDGAAVAIAPPPAMDVQVLIDLAQQDGWDVCLIATPRAFQWLDVPSLTERTGHPVRHDYSCPASPMC
jgi:hypothetical protein